MSPFRIINLKIKKIIIVIDEIQDIPFNQCVRYFWKKNTRLMDIVSLLLSFYQTLNMKKAVSLSQLPQAECDNIKRFHFGDQYNCSRCIFCVSRLVSYLWVYYCHDFLIHNKQSKRNYLCDFRKFLKLHNQLLLHFHDFFYNGQNRLRTG